MFLCPRHHLQVTSSKTAEYTNFILFEGAQDHLKLCNLKYNFFSIFSVFVKSSTNAKFGGTSRLSHFHILQPLLCEKDKLYFSPPTHVFCFAKKGYEQDFACSSVSRNGTKQKISHVFSISRNSEISRNKILSENGNLVSVYIKSLFRYAYCPCLQKCTYESTPCPPQCGVCGSFVSWPMLTIQYVWMWMWKFIFSCKAKRLQSNGYCYPLTMLKSVMPQQHLKIRTAFVI
jgi:hypothetical protein